VCLVKSLGDPKFTSAVRTRSRASVTGGLQVSNSTELLRFFPRRSVLSLCEMEQLPCLLDSEEDDGEEGER
jgi:hypothetical protein